MTQIGTRAVLYLRLSVSRDESTSIDRQRYDLRALAEREGWQIVSEFTDDGLSGGQRREAADAALAMLADNEADVLAVWKFDRWSRQGARAVADLQDVLEGRAEVGNPALFVADRDALRSDTPDWDLRVAITAAMGRAERETIRQRAISSHDGLARARRFAGGPPPYGYRSVPHPSGTGRGLEISTDEARVVRSAAHDVLNGASLYSVAQSLNAQGIAPRRAERWSVPVVRQMLTGDAVLGRMTRRGRPISGDDGLPLQVWDPILTLDESARLRAMFPRRQSPSQAPEERKRVAAENRRSTRRRAARLLSGLLSCASCGSTMKIGYGNKRPDGGRVERYECGSSSASCPKPITITAARIEEHVASVMADAVGHLDVVVEQRVARDAVGLVDVEQALAETARAMTEPGADIASLAQQAATLAERRDQLAAQPRETLTQHVSTGRNYRETWEAEDVHGRRELLRSLLIDRIAVRPGKRGRTGIDPSRLSIPWRWTTEEPDYLAGQLD
ncbi:recombinase family protein [Georgenia sp. H159]|uniref:recombinase family protein n=1 Tax=Georgenia sp. H159 TaxID=3076115 RepID=UPI002D76E3B0|nr:recombinase family protein [Georgenia sp. H159]